MSAPANIGNFSIECDDVERAKHFYEAVFGWRILPWGPPDYYRIVTGTAERPGIGGDLRTRREPLTGTGSSAYECTIVVESLAAVMAAIEANGGKIASRPYRIDGVGELAYFTDSEGNRAGIMEHEAGFQLPEGARA
jgi:predicted enzyme related to lactoylglutathione lyase